MAAAVQKGPATPTRTLIELGRLPALALIGTARMLAPAPNGNDQRPAAHRRGAPGDRLQTAVEKVSQKSPLPRAAVARPGNAASANAAKMGTRPATLAFPSGAGLRAARVEGEK